MLGWIGRFGEPLWGTERDDDHGRGGAAFLLGRHGGVELDLAANFVKVRRLHFYVGIIVKKISY